MTKKFQNIGRKNGVIRGETHEYGWVSIPDEEWESVEDFEGNWEQITEAISEDVFGQGRTSTDSSLKLDYERVVSILQEQIVEYEPDNDESTEIIQTEKQRKAELLLDFLIDKGVYDLEGNEIVVLEEITPDSDEYTKYNWSTFLARTADHLENVVDRAEDLQERIESHYEETDINEVNPDSYKRKILKDLEHITEAESEEELYPQGKTADGRVIPPDSVSDRHKFEYRSKFRKLKAWQSTHMTANGTMNAEKQLGVHIDELETYMERFRHLEQQLRQKSIEDVVDIDQFREDLSLFGTLASEAGVIRDKPVDAMNDEELSDTITDTMDEVGYEIGSEEQVSTEVEEETSDDQQVVTESNSESQVTESSESEVHSNDSEDGGSVESPGGFEEIAGALDSDDEED